MAASEDLLFQVRTPLGFQVRVTRARWQFIVNAKHPVMAGREQEVRVDLESPEEIRKSRTDSSAFLFHRAEQTRRWVCAVARRRDDDGSLITAYPTDAIKEGVRVWPK